MCLYINKYICLSIESRQLSTATDHDLEEREEKQIEKKILCKCMFNQLFLFLML